LISKPDASQVTLQSSTTSAAAFVPDVAGSYTLQLQVTDSLGQTAAQSVTIAVSTTPPVAAVVTKVVFDDSSPVKPTQSVAIGAVISFDASAAATPADNPVAISWYMDEVPKGSTASLSDNGTSAHFTPDVVGEYKVRVRAAHAAGDFVEATYVFAAFPQPAAVLVAQSGTAEKGSFSAYENYQIVLDGSHSTAPSGDVLTKQWALTSKPLRWWVIFRTSLQMSRARMS
jgi:hypothetical protein